jgi:hypothetical protein
MTFFDEFARLGNCASGIVFIARRFSADAGGVKRALNELCSLARRDDLWSSVT